MHGSVFVVLFWRRAGLVLAWLFRLLRERPLSENSIPFLVALGRVKVTGDTGL